MTQQKKNELVKMIDSFLEKRGFSKDGGWAEVESDDICGLIDIVYLLLELKYECDADGDLPVNFQLINRTEYLSVSRLLLPYPEKVESVEKLVKYLIRASLILKGDSERVEWFANEIERRVKGK